MKKTPRSSTQKEAQQGFTVAEVTIATLLVAVMTMFALSAYGIYKKNVIAAQSQSADQAGGKRQAPALVSLAQNKIEPLKKIIENCAQSQDCVGGANGSSIDVSLMGNSVECQTDCVIDATTQISVNREGRISIASLAGGKLHIETLYPAWNGNAIQWVDSDDADNDRIAKISALSAQRSTGSAQ